MSIHYSQKILYSKIIGKMRLQKGLVLLCVRTASIKALFNAAQLIKATIVMYSFVLLGNQVRTLFDFKLQCTFTQGMYVYQLTFFLCNSQSVSTNVYVCILKLLYVHLKNEILKQNFPSINVTIIIFLFGIFYSSLPFPFVIYFL